MINATSEQDGQLETEGGSRQWLPGERIETQIAYWKQQLAGTLPILELPTDRPRSANQNHSRATRSLRLPNNLIKSLETLSQQEDTTLFMTLLAAFNVLLYRYTGQEDILVGSPMTAPNQGGQKAPSKFLNTLVLRTDLSSNPSFRELLARVRQITLGAYAHSDLPFEKLVEILQPKQKLSQNSLFQAMLILEADSIAPSGNLALGSLEVESKILAQVDLALVFQATEEGLASFFNYNTNLFEDATITRLTSHFQTLLEGIVANPDQHLSDLPLLTADERQTLLLEWNNTQTDYPKNSCIHQLFETQVEQTPDAIAVVCENQSLTYRELNAKANQLAHYLRTLGIKPDGLVAICVERSIEMVVGFLGILKAGGAYIPLDPAYPHERRAYKLQDSQAPVILTQERLAEFLPDHNAQVVRLDADWEIIAQSSQENPVNATTPENLAYIIYTSGSTGKPKGVMITHQGLVNHSQAIADQYNLIPNDRVLQFSSMSFDIITEELYPSWISGAAVVLRPEEIASSTTNFWQFVQQEQVTILDLPTAFWHELVKGLSLVKEPLPTSVRLVVVGGEKASRATYSTWLQLVGKYPRWLNTYGPTETTVTTTVYDPARHPEADIRAEIPIGRPIANAKVYILDRLLQPVPIGVPGELYIGGAGLGRGYLNRLDLTNSKFIPDPFSDNPEARLYKTGDTVRYLPDGNIEFVGRIDFQVKIRGFRIELGEIEALLEQHPAVQQAVVIAREDSGAEKRLVAYVILTHEGQVTSPGLRSFVTERLPDYMVPRAFVILEELPMTPNGKVDRRALPVPDVTAIDSQRTIIKPRNLLEFQLVQIWEDILGIAPIGITDNFFELGGHSLLVMRLIAQINEKFGKNMPIATLFDAPTLEQLANLLNQEEDSEPWRSLVAIQTNGSKPPFFCVHEIIGNAIYCQRMARYLPDQPLYGLQTLGLDGKQAPFRCIEDMATHYINEVKTIQPNGPYFLGGYSFGGYVAYEMAQQLQAQGEKVALLTLFDSSTKDYYKRLPLRWFLYQVNQISRHGLGFILDKVKAKVQANWSKDNVKKAEIKESEDWVNADLSKLLQSLKLDTNKLMDRSIEQVTVANWQAMEHYVPQLYQGQVTLFRAILERSAQGWYLDPQLGWGNLVPELDVQEISSVHINMFDEPQVKQVAEKLKVCLDKAQAASAVVEMQAVKPKVLD